MLVFLDTEFTDSLNCDLISIGMVREDGQGELYLERSDYRDDWCNGFVRAAVVPQLGKSGPAVTQFELGERLRAWFATIPEEVTVVGDSYQDWELLLDAMHDMRPANLLSYLDFRLVVDLNIFHSATVEYHKEHGSWHHALHDAKGHRQGWLAWKAAHQGE